MKQTHLQELVMPWFESMPDAALLSALTATAIGVGSLLNLYAIVDCCCRPKRLLRLSRAHWCAYSNAQ